MGKGQIHKETVEQIIRDVCGAAVFKKKKKKSNRKMVETDIDIFAEDVVSIEKIDI